MAWWQADLGHPASLSRSEDRFSYDHRSLEWARYVLGRMGVVDRCPSIVLDALPLVDVIAGCVLLGTGALAKHASSSERRALPRDHAAAVGFEFLKRGEEGVRDFFLAQADHAAESLGASWRGTTVDGSFGWIASAVKRSLTSEVGDICRSGLDAAIDKLGLYSRSTRLGPEPQTSSNLTLTELAVRTQMPKRKVRLIADRLGLVPPARAGSQTYWFTPSQVEAFEAFTADLLYRNEAAERIGLLRPAFDALLAHIDLEPYTRLAGPGPSADMFVGSEVRAFVELVEHRAVVVDQPGLAFDEFCQRSNRSPGDGLGSIAQSPTLNGFPQSIGRHRQHIGTYKIGLRAHPSPRVHLSDGQTDYCLGSGEQSGSLCLVRTPDQASGRRMRDVAPGACHSRLRFN